MDVKTAFLNSDSDIETYKQQPKGYILDPTKVCKLFKAIYGLKQSVRGLYERITLYLLKLGYIQATIDSNVYIQQFLNLDIIIIAIYVDDCILISKLSTPTYNRCQGAIGF